MNKFNDTAEIDAAHQTLITPAWHAPKGVELRLSSRLHGQSVGQYGALNLGLHVGDVPETVLNNRARVAQELPAEPVWLDQVHGDYVFEVDASVLSRQLRQPTVADGSFTQQTGVVLAIMVADCLPVVLASCDGKEIAVVHAGWRGLANGILERAVTKFSSTELQAWLGPAIGPCHYEVDQKVRGAFPDRKGFVKGRDSHHWVMDLCEQAGTQLLSLGVASIEASGICTACDDRFYSHRQTAPTGRFGIFLWKTG